MLIPFSLVDVFAERPLTGNPLAVVPQAEILDESEMTQIAAEFNQAETTFVLPSRTDDADRRLRSFTAAGHEVFGAGHNSLGAWWWLAESGQLPLSDGPNKFIQEIGDDLLPLEINFAEGRLTSVVMTQSPPIFTSVLNDSRIS